VPARSLTELGSKGARWVAPEQTGDHALAQLVIASPQEFLPALTPLRDFKIATGITTELISLESILATSPGRDAPERVKRFLEHRARTAGTTYAFLIGDASKFPVRYTKGQHIESPSVNPQGGRVTYAATDLYYADLFKPDGAFDDWDRNGNGEFGELSGEWTAGTLNVDEVNLAPDIAVGRLPARTPAEVQRYVGRAIAFEAQMPRAWAKRALLVATTDWVGDACAKQDHVATHYLEGYAIQKLYSAGNQCGVTTPPSPQAITAAINDGVGFVSYIGHGNAQGWTGFGRADLPNLTNADRPPFMVAVACDTSWFVKFPPYDAYVDINGVSHTGVNAGEVVSLTAPPRPATIQPGPPVDSMGVDLLVERETGAIGYIGCITGAQPYGTDLGTFFFEARSLGITTVGDMWRHMVTRYYQVHVPPFAVNPTNWTIVAEFHQPWKFFVFGDPSLRLRGVGQVGAILAVEGVPAFLRVHDVGTGYGPPDDFLDVEVVVKLAEAPERAFGFQLRRDDQVATRRGMLALLRRAMRDQQAVRLDFVRTGFLNGRVIRVRALQ
jgi:hypothetical protein